MGVAACALLIISNKVNLLNERLQSLLMLLVTVIRIKPSPGDHGLTNGQEGIPLRPTPYLPVGEYGDQLLCSDRIKPVPALAMDELIGAWLRVMLTLVTLVVLVIIPP